jgi:tRNA (guanine37-N1)-methyltransferase
MKTFNVITVFPEMIDSAVSFGVLSQAQKSKKLQVKTYNPRAMTSDTHRTIDDRPFGGGDGMLMLAEPLSLTIKKIQDPGPVIYLSPQGPLFDDKKAQSLAELPSFTLICGRYGGIDQRFLNAHTNEELSVGNYVLSGGEIAALAVIDATSRFVEGVLGHSESAQKDSLTSGLLEAPAFTRPREWMGVEVPEILLSGNHQQIEEWKLFVGILTTLQKRPETLKISNFSSMQKSKFLKFIDEISLESSNEQRQVLGLSEIHPERLRQWLEK